MDEKDDTGWLLTRFRARDARAAHRVRHELGAASRAAGSEPGLLSYVLYEDREDPTTSWVLEQWATPADARRHEEAVAASGAAERIAGLLAAPLDTRRLGLLPVPAADEED